MGLTINLTIEAPTDLVLTEEDLKPGGDPAHLANFIIEPEVLLLARLMLYIGQDGRIIVFKDHNEKLLNLNKGAD